MFRGSVSVQCSETFGEREQYQGIYPEYWSLPWKPGQSRPDNQQSEWALVFYYILKVQRVGQQESRAELPVDGSIDSGSVGNMLTDS